MRGQLNSYKRQLTKTKKLKDGFSSKKDIISKIGKILITPEHLIKYVHIVQM